MNEMENNNVRQIALQLLMRIEKEGGFSHLIISQAMEKEKIAIIDENLLTEIVYGTMENKLLLDFYLEPFIKKQKKINDWVQMLLRMSLFQLVYLDKVPAYAVINEAVDIAKIRGHRGTSSFVNGVLRNIERKGVRDVTSIEDKVERLAVETSHPLWLVELWNDSYGLNTTKQICETNRTRKPVAVRVNPLKATRDQVIVMLEAEGLEVLPSNLADNGIIITHGNILKTTVMTDGYVTVQDVSSMLAAAMLEAEPEMDVLDSCSAPGGKATFIAEKMDNTGTIYAHDLHKNKLKLIERHANRLGLTNIIVQQHDARKIQELHEPESFDRILVDAPCTGFGVIRSKPDIKYNKSIEDINRLQAIQLDILQEVSPLLKKNGKLVYSTCTINPIENEAVIKQFLHDHPIYEVDQDFIATINEDMYEQAHISEYGMQLFPQSFNSDGFFITRLVRNGNAN